MRIAYIGDFINHGKSLKTVGTSLIILLSLLEEVKYIDIFCPIEDKNVEDFVLPPKVNLQEFYRYNDPISIIRLLRLPWNKYDKVIFNILPTGFGDGTLTNAIALFVPIFLRIINKQGNIKVLYHNSMFTNNIEALGYDSMFDRIRSLFLMVVERILFRNIDTFVLLNLYKQRIYESIGKNKVSVLNGQYLEAIATLYLNKAIGNEIIEYRKSKVPIVLMHGYWGPQKNIELALSALKKVKSNGIEFKLVISGGINHHFPYYEMRFRELIHYYSDVVNDYLGPIKELDIMKIFLNASLLILPYNTPGGHSGVLEQAIFFEVPTIALDFPEYREQATGASNVVFITPDDMYKSVLEVLSTQDRSSVVRVGQKISEVLKNGKRILM